MQLEFEIIDICCSLYKKKMTLNVIKNVTKNKHKLNATMGCLVRQKSHLE